MISLIKKTEGHHEGFYPTSLKRRLIKSVEPPVVHDYTTEKAAREDYALLVKLFKRISGIPEVT